MSLETTIKADVKKFESVLIVVGKDFEKGLTVAVKYLPEATALASIIFPQAAAGLTTATVTATLIQNAVVATEQKYSAQGKQTGTGAAKLADVLTLVNGAVTQLLSESTISSELAKAGITVDTGYITNLVNAVVGVLNVQGAAAVTSATPATQTNTNA